MSSRGGELGGEASFSGCRMMLRPYYAMCGTELAYAATRCAVLSSRMLLRVWCRLEEERKATE
eukprot:580175-Rhodomonas_salina.1